MQRLLEDAQKLSGQKYDLSSYSDIVDAIHVVQTEMGITGTTAKEASTTIEGSVNAAKSAWQNLVVGLADDTQDFDGLVDNFVESVATAGSNIIPRVQKALQGVSKLVTELAPVISEQLPVLVQTVLPGLLTTATELVSGLVSGLIAALPVLAEQAPIIITQLVTVLIENLPMLIDAAVQIIIALTNGITESLPTLIPAAVEAVLTIVNSLIDNLDMLIDAAIELIMALTEGLIAALPTLIAQAPTIIAKLVAALVTNAPLLLTAAVQVIAELAKGLIENLSKIGEAAGKIIDTVVSGVLDLASELWDTGKNIVEGIWQGITDSWDWFWGEVSGFFGGLLDGIKGLLGIHSPSTVFAEIGENMAAGIDVGFTERMKETADNMKKAFNAALNGLTAETLDPDKTWGSVMGMAILTGDTTLTSRLNSSVYGSFAEVAADLERATGMTAAEAYDQMFAMQTDAEEDDEDITTKTTKATKSTKTASSGTSDGDRIYNCLNGNGAAELLDAALGLDFALSTRGDMA